MRFLKTVLSFVQQCLCVSSLCQTFLSSDSCNLLSTLGQDTTLSKKKAERKMMFAMLAEADVVAKMKAKQMVTFPTHLE